MLGNTSLDLREVDRVIRIIGEDAVATQPFEQKILDQLTGELISPISVYERHDLDHLDDGMSLRRLTQIRSVAGAAPTGFQFTKTRDAGRSIAAFGYVAIRMALSDHFSTQDLASLSVSG